MPRRTIASPSGSRTGADRPGGFAGFPRALRRHAETARGVTSPNRTVDPFDEPRDERNATVRTRTVVIGSSAALGLVGLTAVIAPVGDVARLVDHVAKGAPPDTKELAKVEPRSTERANSEGAPNIAPLSTGSETGTTSDVGSESAPPSAEDLLRVEAAEGAAVSFVGTWEQRSASTNGRVRVVLTLHNDGRYSGQAMMFAPGVPADAPPSRRVRSEGAWVERAGNIVLTRSASDDPTLLPVGWREVYWESSVRDGVWTYTDANGLERLLQGVSAGSK